MGLEDYVRKLPQVVKQLTVYPAISTFVPSSKQQKVFESTSSEGGYTGTMDERFSRILNKFLGTGTHLGTKVQSFCYESLPGLAVLATGLVFDNTAAKVVGGVLVGDGILRAFLGLHPSSQLPASLPVEIGYSLWKLGTQAYGNMFSRNSRS